MDFDNVNKYTSAVMVWLLECLHCSISMQMRKPFYGFLFRFIPESSNWMMLLDHPDFLDAVHGPYEYCMCIFIAFNSFEKKRIIRRTNDDATYFLSEASTRCVSY